MSADVIPKSVILYFNGKRNEESIDADIVFGRRVSEKIIVKNHYDDFTANFEVSLYIFTAKRIFFLILQ